MPSPFPGMDPFIEGQAWRDFHDTLILEIRRALVPALQPHYIALTGERTYLEQVQDEPPEAAPPAGLPRRFAHARPLAVGRSAGRPSSPERMREICLEIRRSDTREVVAVIDALSPNNKHAGSEGRRAYQSGRERVLRSDAHLLELDLLRGGQRPPMEESLPPAAYYVILSRSRRRPMADVWPIGLRDRLPVMPVPLAGTDPDVTLDLQAVFATVYDGAGYRYSLSYRRDPEPPLSDEDAAWVREVLASAGG